jgi:hypothetical protein
MSHKTPSVADHPRSEVADPPAAIRCENCRRGGIELERSQFYEGRLVCNICHLDASGNATDYHKDKDEDKVYHRRETGNDSNPSKPPCGSPAEQEPELYGLLERFARQEIEPNPVELGELPPGAGHVQQAMAENIELLIGLRLAVMEDRPLPYSCRFAARQLGMQDHRFAARVIRSLVKAGVIVEAGVLPPVKGIAKPTKLYAPPKLR